MELWDAYNEKGERVPGTLVRGEPVPKGLYHLVCCILVALPPVFLFAYYNRELVEGIALAKEK